MAQGEPQRSQFDQTELLQRIAALEARMYRMENRLFFGEPFIGGGNSGGGGSAGAPAVFGDGSGIHIGKVE